VKSLLSGKSENKLNYTHVFNSETLRRIAVQLPLTMSELAAVEGVAAIKAERYGSQFLEVTINYTCQLSGEIHIFVSQI
jgi:superfamily II DNA helicase RecQ